MLETSAYPISKGKMIKLLLKTTKSEKEVSCCFFKTKDKQDVGITMNIKSTRFHDKQVLVEYCLDKHFLSQQ